MCQVCACGTSCGTQTAVQSIGGGLTRCRAPLVCNVKCVLVCSCACVELRLQSTDGYVQCRLARCRAHFWLHLCNVMCVLVCLCACVLVCSCACVLLCVHVQCVELRLQCSSLVGTCRLARCRAPLLRAVSQLGTSWYQPSPCNPSTPLQGELTATTCAGPFQELVLASTGGTEEASNPSVLGEEGSDFEAHGELNLPL